MPQENYTAKFRVDVSDLKKGIKEANDQIKKATAEFKNATAGMDKWSDSAEGLTAKIEEQTKKAEAEEKKLKLLKEQLQRLNDKQKDGQKIVEDLTKKYEAAAATYGETSDEAKDYAKQLGDAEAAQKRNEDAAKKLEIQVINQDTALKNCKAQVDKYQTALEQMTSESKDSKDQTERLTDTINRQESELRELKDKYIEVATQQGKNSDEARALAGEIKDLSGELKQNKDRFKDAADSADDFDDSLEETSSGGISTFSIALGNLIANVVENAISKLQELVTNTIAVGTTFDTSMSKVAALSGASEEEMSMLRDTAKEFGASTQFSASQAADALSYMALAGWDANQSAEGLPGILNLAAASQMDLAQASDLVTDYLSAFGLQASDSARFADILAYAQSKSNTTTQALGEAFKNSAANMNAAGQDVETTTALLAMLANQGLKGSEAGTALTAVMRDMTAKMKDGKIMIGDTAVAVQDANGNYRDLTDILLDVEKATNGMGDAEKATALQSTFTADSIKGLNLILNAGVGEAAKFEEELRNSGGTAEETAKIMNDNLGGDLTALSSKLEGVQIALYEKLEPALREGVEWLSKLLDYVIPFVEALEPLAPLIIAVASALGVMTTAMLGMMIVKKVSAAMAVFNATLAANPIVIVVAAIAGLVAGFIYLWKTSDKFRNFWINLWKKIKGVAVPVINWLVKAFKTIWTTMKTTWDTIKPILVAIWDFLKIVIKEVVEMFKAAWGAIKAIWDFVEPYFMMIWENIKAIFSVVVSVLGGYFKVAWETIKLVWDVAVKYFTLIWNNIKTVFSAVVNVLGGFFKAAWNSIKVVWDLVVGYFKMIWDNIKLIFSVVEKVFKGDFSGAWDAIKQIWDNVVGYFSDVWDGIKNIFGNVTGFFEEAFSEAWKAVKNVFSGVGEFFSGIWDTITKQFTEIGTAIGDAVGGAFKSVINAALTAVENTINTGIKLINNAIDIINKIPKVEISHVKEVEFGRLAKGGITNGPTFAEIGEDGKEAVIPLEKNKGGLKMIANLLAEEIASSGLLSGTKEAIVGAGDTINNYNFNQTNNSPKALSRYDIYRQTKNLVNAMKGV